MRSALLIFLSTALAIAPLAATAAERTSAVVPEGENLNRSPMLVIVLVAFFLGGLVILLSNKDNPTSP